jgi:hypothetical protein
MFYLPDQTTDVVKPFGSTMKKASKKEVEARDILWPRNWDRGYRRQVWSVPHVTVWERKQ